MKPAPDYLFNAFLGVLAFGPVVLAFAFSAWWLLAYVPVLLIVGL